MKFSIIIAIYNRKDELIELLKSLQNQTYKSFEIIIIDDGSKIDLYPVIDHFKTFLDINYHKKENSGPGLSRNFGAKLAKNEYLIFLDSDCIAPNDYIQRVSNQLNKNNIDAFGGPDSAHQDFNTLQKAISYSMTSIFTTGGIRGAKKSLGKFQPRSFNMGIKKDIFLILGGFSEMRIGEDPDLSMKLWENNFKTQLFLDAKVFHKRRTSIKKFAKQVFQFGIARPILNQRHPIYTKITFWFPTLFLLGTVFAILLFFIGLFFIDFSSKISFIFIRNLYEYLFFIPIILLKFYFILIFIHSSIKNKSIKIGFLSIFTSAIQLYSYGFGFLKSFYKLNILKINPKKAFPSHFYI